MGTLKHIQRKSDAAHALIQPRLEVGRENDQYEQEADHVADKVMRMPDAGAAVKKMPATDAAIKRMPDVKIRKMPSGASGGMAAPRHVEQGIAGSKGNGSSLSPEIQQEMGNKMGADLSAVKIHTDGNAARMSKDIGAKAFTHGNDIYFNQGQYNPSSEQGKHLLAHELTHTVQQSGAIQKQEIQRKKEVPTDYGKFKTEEFRDIDLEKNIRNPTDKFAVEAVISFYPDTQKVDASKIGLSQAVKTTNGKGEPYAIDPNAATKMVPKGQKGEGYTIDQLPGNNNPIYSQDSFLEGNKGLKDTPNFGGNFALGFPKSKDPKEQPATLVDIPTLAKNASAEKTFETTVFALEGIDRGKYYGSVKWGFKVTKDENGSSMTSSDITFVSNGTPSQNFMQAAALWNKGTAMGTLKVIADPAAAIIATKDSDPEKDKFDLPKDTLLKFMKASTIVGVQYVLAEVVNEDKTPTGKVYFVKTSDVQDMGDGPETKNLPVKKTNEQVKMIMPKPVKGILLSKDTRIMILPATKGDDKYTNIEVLDGSNIGMSGKIKNKDLSKIVDEGD